MVAEFVVVDIEIGLLSVIVAVIGNVVKLVDVVVIEVVIVGVVLVADAVIGKVGIGEI
jgi:hypothetical protein